MESIVISLHCLTVNAVKKIVTLILIFRLRQMDACMPWTLKSNVFEDVARRQGSKLNGVRT